MVPTMLDNNKNDTKCTPLESTKLDVERSKREDLDIKLIYKEPNESQMTLIQKEKYELAKKLCSFEYKI
jgi:hypothetical protein